MALASTPSTPERATPPPWIRRSFTAPIRSSRSIPLPEVTGDGAETLYAHAAGRIVSFNNQTSLVRRHPSISTGRAELQEEPVGTLPWFSTTERTLAAGMLHLTLKLHDALRLSYFHRAPTDLQSPGHGLSKLWHDAATPSIKITVLVCGRRIKICTPNPAERLLSYRIATSKL